jgi:hypothetical protein
MVKSRCLADWDLRCASGVSDNRGGYIEKAAAEPPHSKVLGGFVGRASTEPPAPLRNAEPGTLSKILGFGNCFLRAAALYDGLRADTRDNWLRRVDGASRSLERDWFGDSGAVFSGV